DNIHISLIGQRIILVVIFDQRSSLGLVRLRVKKTSEVLTRLFDDITSKAEKEKVEGGKAAESPFAEISDEDIDNLFK
ncbi:MAG: roadblock/LC7 domain-containing protein, partial [Nitrospirota bacterium]